MEKRRRGEREERTSTDQIKDAGNGSIDAETGSDSLNSDEVIKRDD